MPGVTVRELETMAEMHAVSDLLAAVWGKNDEGVPIPSEVLRGLVHAGGLVNGAYDGETLVGAAALGRVSATASSPPPARGSRIVASASD